jgi:predicted porin
VLNRQTYLSFGDKSWGSVKLGKDLGIYASDAILNDMTLLGVGAGAASSSTLNSTAGGIGTGYQYAAWKGQIAYTTPNFSGFQATVGITNPEQMAQSTADNGTSVYQSRFGVEGKASYSFNVNDVAGKVWTSGASYDVSQENVNHGKGTSISAYDIGANINVAGLGLTGYYYDGKGNGITFLGLQGLSGTQKRDGNGGYVQATYVLPFKTKIGAAWGRSELDGLAGDNALTGVDAITKKQERWTVGAYHPLTKHLNLVAEYSDLRIEGQNNAKNEYNTMSLGAILFF